MTDWTGGCLCREIRFRLLSDPFDAGWCHCRTCQLSSGSPAMAFASVRAGDWRIEQGEAALGTIKSSSFGHRAFCKLCGTPLYMKVDHQPDTLDFSLPTLDDPAALAPAFHIFYKSRIAWAAAADALPRHDRFRPQTKGLEGTEPPVVS
jgi:hypothetical protein